MPFKSNRPNAFEVSFPDEAAAIRQEEQARLTAKFAPTLQTLKKPANANPRKRKGDERRPLVNVQGVPRPVEAPVCNMLDIITLNQLLYLASQEAKARSWTQ